jgi:predicted CoA-substrate-specific enzyme activase
MPAAPLPERLPATPMVLGLDIGSTGSKAALLEAGTGAVLWHAFRRTGGDPAGAARSLVEDLLRAHPGAARVVAFGVTGSGRDIVGRLLAACYGRERVHVVNEIAAHAAGAVHHDPEVDTIFEIGGQDAKYIRLSDGHVCDAAMNEACSAGTGSFLEEQGTLFAEVAGLADLSRRALAAPAGVSLGQHCSVFMAGIIEKALADGQPVDAVIAGLYDSVIQNYLNRVKGARSVGRRIFCQGMPFAAPALAAAVARQTGRAVIVPPNPGMMGAIGIALIARRGHTGADVEPADLAAFATVRVAGRRTLVCRATRGCGPPGNRCRIERLTIEVGDRREPCLWGGSCALHDRGFGARGKLPDRAPDPFRERRLLLERIITDATAPRGRPRVGMTPEFVLAGLFPLFVTFIRELGFDPLVPAATGRDVLRRGAEEHGIPVCAPVQLYAGAAAALLEAGPDYVLLPMLRHLPRRAGQPTSTLCPLTQASGDVLASLRGRRGGPALVRPVLDMGPGNLRSALFRASLGRLAAELGVAGAAACRRAAERATAVQEEFDAALQAFGAEALRFAREHRRVAVVILGRAYTLHHPLLNAGLPGIVRELGALPVPVDCYPVPESVPSVPRVYWGHGHDNVRAALQVLENDDHVALYCSTYSCGPDSLVLPLCAHVLRDKPFCTIETDAHSGDAGTRTRVEAFLHCVDNYRRAPARRRAATEDTVRPLLEPGCTFAEARRENRTILIPRMGEGARYLAAALRGDGFRAEALPETDRQALRYGRAHTSGKECLPAILTLGALLKRLENAGPDEPFAFFMPSANGPCRFGLYHLLHRLVLESVHADQRVRMLVPHSENYFVGITPSLAVKCFASFVACDTLEAALLHTRPVERERGAADRVHAELQSRILAALDARRAPRPLAAALAECGGSVFGLLPLLREAAARFAALVDPARQVPTVALVGEIYVRMDPFANDFSVARLEERGLRVRLAPFTEWIEYVDAVNRQERRVRTGRALPSLRDLVPPLVRRLVHDRLSAPLERTLHRPAPPRVRELLRASAPYLRREMLGEAVLTLGYPIAEFRRGRIAGVVSVGPFECMPNKIAEALFAAVTRDTGLPAVTLSLNGDPLDASALEAFAYEVKAAAGATAD